MTATKHPKRRPLNRTAVAAQPHPSNGRGFAYSQDLRQLAMAAKLLGLENDPTIHLLRNARLYPSKTTTRRHLRHLQFLGHLRRFRWTGNKHAKVLRGHLGLMLVLYRLMYPKCTAAEMNAFLFNCQDPNQPRRLFDPSQLSCTEDFYGLSRKNRMKRHLFWMQNYPFGIANIRKEDIIDVAESCSMAESTNRPFGKA